MLRIHATVAILCVLSAAPSAAQTLAEIEAEPVVKLQRGETAVPDQCLTQQELDLIQRRLLGPRGFYPRGRSPARAQR